MNKITRRGFVAGAMGTAALASATPLMAKSMDHMGHGGMAKNAKLSAAAADCVIKGTECVDHCILLLKEKDLSLVKCLETAQDAVDACQLLMKYSAGNQKHLSALAEVCIKVCEDCAKECKKHIKKHENCKACYDSCKECIKECKKVA
ncbi:MAG: four-helix bundle copper-binding protein [SAR324 cluster bacterium]|nr:four-helix bundle copper-binding protein [SAR324 cluster bacterium]